MIKVNKKFSKQVALLKKHMFYILFWKTGMQAEKLESLMKWMLIISSSCPLLTPLD